MRVCVCVCVCTVMRVWYALMVAGGQPGGTHGFNLG